MPMQRELYPANWNEIATKVKEESEWVCEECDRPCRKPGVDWMEFELWLYNNDIHWWNDIFALQKDGYEKRKPQRFTLTVAHLNHKPEDCDRSNLKALCSVCHLRYDKDHHVKSRAVAIIANPDQLNVFDVAPLSLSDAALPLTISSPKKSDGFSEQRSQYHQKVRDRFALKSANLTRFLFCLSVWCIAWDTEYASVWLWGWRRVQMLKFESLRSYQ